MNVNRLRKLAGMPPLKEQQLNEVAGDDLNMKAVDLIDDMLAALPENEQYGERGDVLRYILQILQG